MKKEEARAILRRYNICEIHGCNLVEQRNVHPEVQWKREGYFYCPQCEAEQLQTRGEEIAEAKRALGLR